VRDLRLARGAASWALEVDSIGDITMEQMAAKARTDMFTEVFGRQLIIRLAGVVA
jgi:hypothetical protein